MRVACSTFAVADGALAVICDDDAVVLLLNSHNSKNLEAMLNYSIRMTLGSVILFALVLPQNVYAFQVKTSYLPPSHVLRGTTGGWGIGPSKEMKDEEFSNASKRRVRKRRDSSSSDEMAYYGMKDMEKSYELEDSVSFAEKVKKEKQSLKEAQMKDLMKIAQIAGIGKTKNKVNVEETNVFEPKNRMGKFEPDVVNTVEDDNLDVRVTWDE